jgi:Transferase family
MVVGCTFDHRVVDAYSFNMFIAAWANISLGQPINRVPFFSNSLLSTQLPFLSNPSDPLLDRLYAPLSLQPPTSASLFSTAPINRIYYISAIDIARLQEIAGHKHSKMVSFTAHLWQILAKSTCRGEKSCSMGIVVDGRSRMKNYYGTKFMKNYFGNVLSVPFGNLHTETLFDKKLAEVADEVHNWLSPALMEDHFIGLLDWVEAHRPEKSAARIYIGDDKEEKSISCVVSSGRGFPEINFGWGNAVFGSYHFSWGGDTGYLMPIPQLNTGDWVVFAHVAPSVIAVMEEEPTIFHKLTSEYIFDYDKPL